MNTILSGPRGAVLVLVTAITAGSLAGSLSAVALTNTAIRPAASESSPAGATTVSYDVTDVEAAITHVAATASDSVVQVVAQVRSVGPFGAAAESSGSGFVVSSDGLIVTSRHVIDGATAVTVILADGLQRDASVVATDATNDLAVLRVSAGNLPDLSLAPAAVEVGQTVIAIGTPLGEFANSVTTGIVSGLDRSVDVGSGRGSEHLDGVIQTDAALSSGMSGGPILNVGGQVVGVTTAVAGSAQGVGFAEPAAVVAALLATIA